MPVVEYRSRPSALAYMSRAMLSARCRAPAIQFPQLSVRWRGARAVSRDIDEMCALAEQPRSAFLPFLYFHVVGFRLHMALLTHPAFPVPIWRMLQVRNALVQHRRLRRSASIDFELRLAAVRIFEKGLEADVSMTVSESGELAWESVNTFYARGAFGTTSANREPSPAESPGPVIATWTTPAGGALRFARLTGDYNGLHLSDFYAKRLGFGRASLHAQRVLGVCLARLPALDCEAPCRMEAWIKGPVAYGVPVSLRANEHQAGYDFGLWTDFDPRPAIVARVARLRL
jgi:hypothetical protein